MTESPDTPAASRRVPLPPAPHLRHLPPGYDSRGLVAAATAVIVITFMAIGTWSSYHTEFRNDQYQLIQLGQCVQGGDTLYVDCWENKPPGIAWINAMAIMVGGGGQLFAWLLPGIAGLLAILVFYLAIARALGFAPACVTALLAAVVLSLRVYDAPSINPDYYSAALELTAGSVWVLALTSRRGGRRFCWGVAAGLIWAGAFTVKQTGAVGLIAVTVVAVVSSVSTRFRNVRWWSACACCWIGFISGVVCVGIILARQQALEPALNAVFRFNADLFNAPPLSAWAGRCARVWAWAQPVGMVLWLGMVGAIVALRTERANKLTRSFIAVMLIWWIAQATLATMGPSQSPRYLQAAFPAMLWLAAVGTFQLEEMVRQTGRRRRILPVVLLTTAVLLLGRPLMDAYTTGVARAYLAYSEQPTQREQLGDMGRRIRALVPHEGRIYVWNYDAGVYVHAQRGSAAAFTYPRSAQQMREILASLQHNRTRLLLFPDSGSTRFDAWCGAACFAKLKEILQDFEPIESIGGYNAWLRGRDVSLPSDPAERK